LPTQLDNLSSHAVKVDTAERDVRILPGLAQRSVSKPDVMRGEETLLLGAIASDFSYQHYCIPGTHSKWVNVVKGEIQEFQTFMTGEMFALFSKTSTLSYFIDQKDEGFYKDDAFKKAVCEIYNKPELLTSALFSIRSSALLFPNKDKVSFASRLSGLLIGAELAAMKSNVSDKIGLIARDELADHYVRAMNIAGMDFEVIDSHELALCGLKFAASRLWPN